MFGYVRPDLVNGASFDLNKFDEVYEFVCSLFDEFLDGEDPVFQSSVFHIGTDESSNSAENMRKYIDAMTKYCMSKDNIDEVRFWANLSLYRGQTPVTTDATMQIWDARDQYADEALEWADLVNSTSSKMYIVPGNGPNWVNFTDWKDPVWLYENWKSVSDFDTYGIPEGHAYYGKYNILRGHPQIKGAEGCIWNDTANGFSDRDIFDRAKDYNVVIAEKAWYGDTNRFASGEDFVKAYTPLDTKVPGGNPNRYVDSKGDTIAKYDFESTTADGLATDLSGNGYDAVITAQIRRHLAPTPTIRRCAWTAKARSTSRLTAWAIRLRWRWISGWMQTRRKTPFCLPDGTEP
ncbi:MAG: family 20 glycosylhydrolase [Oscillospiraceae bacterium]